MVNAKEAIKMVKESKFVYICTRMTEHDMALVRGNKGSLLDNVKSSIGDGVDAFNMFLDAAGDVIVG